jgi:hypothetical protein
MSFGHRFVLSICLLLASFGSAESQPRTRRNFYGMHNLKDGGAAIPEGMNWTRHLVGEGASVMALPGAHSATTSSRGEFTLSLSEGSYTVTASLDGYVPATESAVTVLEGQTAVVDFTLERASLPPPPATNLIANGDFAFGLAYDGLLGKDDYVLGATIFALEIPGWFSFDIAPIVDRLAAYVAASR